MKEYRTGIVLDPESTYWYVEMGVLNHLNGASRYPFPTEHAAIRFAAAHKRRAPHRAITVRYPDGRELDIEPTELGDIHEHPE
ncbi:hypothetical protein KIV66_gp70 [Mycobacterium phage MyraDee]|uniref:DUF2188 domain-containing protein n=1 Tax=Mycobacterium phage MyraDee TaxID=2024303 RepID=A0A222YZQ7_9CAUD|nr:hypothetical protein KIV66_gp70 [Mycobacterium phage MyraDee]ASR77177.1 hypothetical protein SEA_MYRADEE_70 [Mycobacterium phage MyraDee]